MSVRNTIVSILVSGLLVLGGCQAEDPLGDDDTSPDDDDQADDDSGNDDDADDDSAADDDDAYPGWLAIQEAADAVIQGEASGNATGHSVAGAGDVDADGHDDILIGAPYAGNHAGKAYLLQGPLSGDIHLLHDLNVTVDGATLEGAQAYERVGGSVSAAGDTDGDGQADVLVGAPASLAHGETDIPGVALLRGPLSGEHVFGATDATYMGIVDDSSGCSVASAGDVDADGYDDVLYGAKDSVISGEQRGAAFLFLSPAHGHHDQASADAVIAGESPVHSAGKQVAGVGDVDADGHDDILVTSHQWTDPEAWSAYHGFISLFLGPLLGTHGALGGDTLFLGEDQDDRAGEALSGAGDVNGDGFDDILIGACGCCGGSPNHEGRVYLIHGPPPPGEVSLAEADAIFFAGPDGGDAGRSVAIAGDVNGDGFDDVLIGTVTADIMIGQGGAAYLFLGPVLSDSLQVFDADLKLAGNVYDQGVGYSVAGAGDVNADGYDDFLLGGTGGVTGAMDGPGYAYLFLGGTEL